MDTEDCVEVGILVEKRELVLEERIVVVSLVVLG